MKSVLLILSSLTVWLASCVDVKQVKDSSIPYERPSYSILPPSGDNWYSREKNGAPIVVFVKKFDSKTHLVQADVEEVTPLSKYHDPEEFLNSIKKSFRSAVAPSRYNLQVEEIKLDDRFGAYSVQSHIKYVDHYDDRWAEKRLFVEIYGYTFLHPDFKDLAIHIYYGEQGEEREEIDPHFEETAQKFIAGLKLKKPE
jgi:hypothetical protein